MAAPWERYGGGQGGTVFTVPADPTTVRTQDRQDRTEQRQASNDVASNAAREKQYRLERSKTIADLAKQGKTLDASDNIVDIPGWKPPLTPEQQKEQTDRVGRLNALVGQINRTQTLGNQGPLSTHGLAGLADYNPWSDNNARFDTAGASLSQQGLAAFRTPGTGTVSDRDAIMFDRANMPQASTLDASNEEVMRGLRARVDEEYRSMGIPTPQWEGVGGQQQQGQRNDQPPMAMVGVGGQGGGGGPAPLTLDDYASPNDPSGPAGIASGALLGPRVINQPDPETGALLDQMYRSGASFEQISAFAASRGVTGVDPAQFAARKKFDAEYAASHGGRTYNGPFYNATRRVEQSPLARASQGIPGAAVIGATNAATFGGVGALAPEQMAMVQQSHPVAEGVGEIAGVLGGMKMGGGLIGGIGGRSGVGANVLSKFRALPSPARNLIADTSYGTARGAVENPDNPGAGALMGGLSAGAGSIAGQAIGSLAGRTLSGVTSSPTIARLRAGGVTPTIGQIMRGRVADNGGRSFVSGIEDTIANTPVAGTFVNTARGRALADANTHAFNVASEGAPITGTGVDALDQLAKVKSDAYDNALAGVNLPANDARFMQQIDAADQAGRRVDAARNRGDFGYIMDDKLGPIMTGGQNIRGRQLQDGLRLIQGQRRAYGKAAAGAAPDPMAGGVADALGSVEDAFIGSAARNAPGAIAKLKTANRINRNLSVLDSAGEAATNNGGVFTGAQLGSAIQKNNTVFGKRGLLGRSTSPLHQVQQDMQSVLPSQVPPTGVNVAPWLAAGGLAAGGANEGTGLDSTAVRTASLAALMATPYTRLGSKAVAKALLDRPEKLKALGALIRQKKGLLGTAAAPLMLEAQQ